MASQINASNSGFGGIVSTGDSSGVLQLQTAGTTAVTIDTSQNVGIGTSSPSYKLDVVGGINASSNISTASGNFVLGTNDTYLGFASNNIKFNNTSDRITLNTGAAERMRIDSNGNVLVGTTTSTGGTLLNVYATSKTALDIRTTTSADGIYGVFNTGGSSSTAVYVFPMRFGSTSTFIGGIYYNGSVLSLQGTSDERLKENIVDSSSGLDKLKNIKVRSFDWKDGRGHVDFGVIAQELNEIAPEAVVVGKDNEDGTIETPWSADASLLVPVLIKAIQEQQTIINDLKARIETLESK